MEEARAAAEKAQAAEAQLGRARREADALRGEVDTLQQSPATAGQSGGQAYEGFSLRGATLGDGIGLGPSWSDGDIWGGASIPRALIEATSLSGGVGGSGVEPRWWADYQYYGPSGDLLHVQKNQPLLFDRSPVSWGLWNGESTFYVTGSHPTIRGPVDYLSDSPVFDPVTTVAEVEVRGDPQRARMLRQQDENYWFSQSLAAESVSRSNWRLGMRPSFDLTNFGRGDLTERRTDQGARYARALEARQQPFNDIISGKFERFHWDNPIAEELFLPAFVDPTVDTLRVAGATFNSAIAPVTAYVDSVYGPYLERTDVSPTLLGDTTEMAASLAFGSKAGVGAGQVRVGVSGVATETMAPTATYARGSAERAFLLEELRAARGSGATRFAEQRGIVFGHREAGRLGYDPVLTSLQYGSGNGLDGLFIGRTTGELAIWEFKGGATHTGLGSLRTYGSFTQGSQAYIENRLLRYSQAPNADMALEHGPI